MANEIAEFKIKCVGKLDFTAVYKNWAPSKIQRVRFELGTWLIESLEVNECSRCDLELTVDNVDSNALSYSKTFEVYHIQCPPEASIVEPMPTHKPPKKSRFNF